MKIREARPYLAETVARTLKGLDADTARVVAEELKSLPTIESMARSTLALPGLEEGYKAVALPSGYLAVYRQLSDAEAKEMPGGYSPDEDSYLVADLVSLMDDIPHRLTAS